MIGFIKQICQALTVKKADNTLFLISKNACQLCGKNILFSVYTLHKISTILAKEK